MPEYIFKRLMGTLPMPGYVADTAQVSSGDEEMPLTQGTYLKKKIFFENLY